MKTQFYFDIDGTLYNNASHQISEKTIYALEQLKNKGHQLFLITSRSLHEMKHLPQVFLSLPFDGWIVDGGALVLDAQKNILHKSAIDPALMENFVEQSDKKGWIWRYSNAQCCHFASKPDVLHRHVMNYLYLESPSYKAFNIQQDEALNLLIWIENEDQEKEVLDMFKGHSIVSYPTCLEVRAPQTSKENALVWMKEQTKPLEMICFGDGPNDIGMMEQADVSVAMGNAASLVKEKASYVAPSILEDGVYSFLCEHKIIEPMKSEIRGEYEKDN